MKRLVIAIALLFATPALATDLLIAPDLSYGWGQSSGASTVSLKTIDVDNINPDFTDGTMVQVVATYIARQGSNIRTMQRRSLFLMSGGEFTQISTDLVASSSGSIALVAVSTSIDADSGSNSFTIHGTGVALLTIDWAVRIESFFYRPAD